MVILKVWSEQGSRVFFFIISKLEAFPVYDIMMESLLLHSPMADVNYRTRVRSLGMLVSDSLTD